MDQTLSIDLSSFTYWCLPLPCSHFHIFQEVFFSSEHLPITPPATSGICLLFPFISSVILKSLLYSTHISSCISSSHTFFFFYEHYEMTLHAYVNAVRNSLKDNIHLTASASSHLHFFCHNLVFSTGAQVAMVFLSLSLV